MYIAAAAAARRVECPVTSGDLTGLSRIRATRSALVNIRRKALLSVREYASFGRSENNGLRHQP